MTTRTTGLSVDLESQTISVSD